MRVSFVCLEHLPSALSPRTLGVVLALATSGATSVATATPAKAQLLLEPSFQVGAAVPARNEAEAFGAGLHLGAALDLPILPFRIEAALDRMGSEGEGDDLTIWSAGVAAPIGLTPPLVPVGVYLLLGGGLYRHETDIATTDPGISAGAGVSLGLGLSLFAEGRGVLVFSGGNRLTYLTAGAGLRF